MLAKEIVRAWGAILSGRRPSLSIEITRECPLTCPGCYAYEDSHLGGSVTLRDLRDLKGDELVDGVLDLVDRLRPAHLSIVGGDPLVRHRELERMLPALIERGIHVQLVTSAFRRLSDAWAGLPRLNVVVSVDGLEADHNLRRAPATYERILKNIEGHRVTVHCTITAQQMQRPGYHEEFTAFWSARSEVKRIWFSIFTPQRGARAPEMLSGSQRARVISELLAFRSRYPKLDMHEKLIREFATPPQSPDACIFAQTTETISADLKTRITPCQFGGDPDCSQCGCVASMGLAAIGNHRLGGVLPIHWLFRASLQIGRTLSGPPEPSAEPQFRIVQ